MRKRLIVAALAATLTLGLAACNSSEKKDSAHSQTSASASASQSAEAAPNVVESAEGMPTIEEKDGVPSLVFAEGSKAPAGLQAYVAQAGNGEEIKDSDLLVVDYIGYVWGKTESFDSSFSRKAPAMFWLQKLVKGWPYTIAGHHVGDTLVISIPPKYGYGEQGQSSAGISGTDTIVFYVKVHARFDGKSAGQADATEETPLADLPITYSAKAGEPITDIAVKDGAEPPSELEMKVINRGSGEAVEDNDGLLVSYAVVPFSGDQAENTWTADETSDGYGPQQVAVSAAANSPFSKLIGVPVGSRVFLQIPAQGEDSTKGFAAVIDILYRVKLEAVTQ